jgi:hypothetical protein
MSPTSLVMIDDTVISYRTLLAGFMALFIARWSETEQVFQRMLVTQSDARSNFEKDYELLESLFCGGGAASSADCQGWFQQNFDGWPQYYRRQAINSAVHCINRNILADAVRLGASAGEIPDLFDLIADRPLSHRLNPISICNDLHGNDGYPFGSSSEEIFAEKRNEKTFAIKLLDKKGRSWRWCEGERVEVESSKIFEPIESAGAKAQVGPEIFSWNEGSLSSPLELRSESVLNVREAPALSALATLEIRPSFLDFARREHRRALLEKNEQ